MKTIAEVWCSKCGEPATVEFRLTTGETVARCDQDAWLLRAPHGGKRPTNGKERTK